MFTVFCFAILVSELSQQHHGEGRTDAEEQGGGSNPVAMFVYATTFTDCIGFLIGMYMALLCGRVTDNSVGVRGDVLRGRFLSSG